MLTMGPFIELLHFVLAQVSVNPLLPVSNARRYLQVVHF